jgi:hypothetical protein
VPAGGWPADKLCPCRPGWFAAVATKNQQTCVSINRRWRRCRRSWTYQRTQPAHSSSLRGGREWRGKRVGGGWTVGRPQDGARELTSGCRECAIWVSRWRLCHPDGRWQLRDLMVLQARARNPCTPTAAHQLPAAPLLVPQCSTLAALWLLHQTNARLPPACPAFKNPHRRARQVFALPRHPRPLC